MNVTKKITSEKIVTNQIINEGETRLNGILHVQNHMVGKHYSFDPNKNHIKLGGNVNISDNLIIPRVGNNNSEGSVYYNELENKFYGHYGNVKGWKNLGGIDDSVDTNIEHNLNVKKQIDCLSLNIRNSLETHTLKVKGSVKFEGYTEINELHTNQLVLPEYVKKNEGSLYTKYNNVTGKELKLYLNNKENSIILNESGLASLDKSTDLFQFYNVLKGRQQYGNRVTGLNDPQYNSFSKFYVINEYIFHEKRININSIEYYVSHNNSIQLLVSFKLKVHKTRNEVLTERELTVLNLNKGKIVLITEIENTDGFFDFIQNDVIKISINPLNDNSNGCEIFCRLCGNSQIFPVIDSVHITSDNSNNTSSGKHNNALLVNGGGYFEKNIRAQSVSTFTGCHISELKMKKILNEQYCNKHNNEYIYNNGLIVSIKDSKYIDILNSEFDLELTNSFHDKTVFGVISSYLNDDTYMINSLGEGGIWISNINGEMTNGDYISGSIIPGYGCKQKDDILHNYTVAKCCTNINWNNVHKTLYYNGKNYKIIFVACTYHCG